MILRTIIFSYLVICFLVFLFQRKLQYFPNQNLKDPSFYGLRGFEVETLINEDNLKITSWFKAPKKGKKIIVYFHGNSDNLGGRSSRYDLFSKAGFGIMALSYQGFGSSQGNLSQKSFEKNVTLTINFLFEKGFKAEDMVFYGESMGSFLAIKQATRTNPYALILEAPFYSILEIAKNHYWYLPVFVLLKDKFESNRYASKVKSKTLIFHGNVDNVVPISSGKKLFKLLTSQKKFIEVPNAGHIAIDDGFLLDEIEKFLN